MISTFKAVLANELLGVYDETMGGIVGVRKAVISHLIEEVHRAGLVETDTEQLRDGIAVTGTIYVVTKKDYEYLQQAKKDGLV